MMIEITVAEAYRRRPLDGFVLFYKDVVVSGIEPQSQDVYLLHNPRFPNGIPVAGECPLRMYDAQKPRYGGVAQQYVDSLK